MIGCNQITIYDNKKHNQGYIINMAFTGNQTHYVSVRKNMFLYSN